MEDRLARLFDQHAASTFDKQLLLEDKVGDLDWTFDLDTLTLRFNHLIFSVQLLGTESTLSATWQWAWAQDSSDIARGAVRQALRVRALGLEQRIAELSRPQVKLSRVDGHYLATLATGLCEAKAYYRCPFDNGALFVLIQSNLGELPQRPLERVTAVLPQAITTYKIQDCRLALFGLLERYNLPYTASDDKVLVVDGENRLKATFDSRGRLVNLETSFPALS